MKKLAIVLEDMGPNQIAMEVCSQHNFHYEIYWEDFQQSQIKPKMSSFPLKDIFGFDGAVIATNARQVLQLKQFFNIKNIIYYAYNLDWFYCKSKFGRIIYKETPILTRSKQYSTIIKDVWGVESTVVEKINLKEIEEYSGRIFKI